MALFQPFLNSTILFSSISPEYKSIFLDETTSCEIYIGIPHETLWKMPTYMRKYYINKHNDSVKIQKETQRNIMKNVNNNKKNGR